jgi:predicted RNase H-like nuclease (RuvC/YqgF family)
MSAGPVKSLADQTRRRERGQAKKTERQVLHDETQQHAATTIELLEELEAEFVRLRAQNRRLTDSLKQARKEAAALKRKVESLEKKVAKKKAAKLAPQVTPAAAERVEKPAPKRQVLGKTLSQLRLSRRGVAEQNQSGT